MQPRGGTAPVPMSYCGRCRRRQKGPLTRPGRPSEPPQLRGWTQAQPSENRPQGGIGRVHHRLSRPLGTSGLVLDPSNGLGHDINNNIGLEPRLTTGARVVGAPNGPADQRAFTAPYRRANAVTMAWTAMTGTGAVGQRAKNRPLCFVEETLPLGQPLSRCPCQRWAHETKTTIPQGSPNPGTGRQIHPPSGAACAGNTFRPAQEERPSNWWSLSKRPWPRPVTTHPVQTGTSRNPAVAMASTKTSLFALSAGAADSERPLLAGIGRGGPQALPELEALPSGAWGHPLAVSVRVSRPFGRSRG